METTTRTKSEIEEQIRGYAIGIHLMNMNQNQKKSEFLRTFFGKIPSLTIKVTQTRIEFVHSTGKIICEGWIDKKYGGEEASFSLSYSSSSSQSSDDVNRTIALGEIFKIYKSKREEILRGWMRIEDDPEFAQKTKDCLENRWALEKELKQKEEVEYQSRFNAFLTLIESNLRLTKRMKFEVRAWQSHRNNGIVSEVVAIRLVSKTPKTYTVEMTIYDSFQSKENPVIYTITPERMRKIFNDVIQEFQKTYGVNN